jgi:hypothetical protein
LTIVLRVREVGIVVLAALLAAQACASDASSPIEAGQQAGSIGTAPGGANGGRLEAAGSSDQGGSSGDNSPGLSGEVGIGGQGDAAGAAGRYDIGSAGDNGEAGAGGSDGATAGTGGATAGTGGATAGTGGATAGTGGGPSEPIPALVRINEFNANIAGACDLVELRVVSSGNMNGFVLRQRDTGAIVTFGDLAVLKNSYVVVHLNATSGTCNPGQASQEFDTTATQPASAYGGNYDTAFDWWSSTAGLIATDSVLTVYDAHSQIIDAVFVSNDPAGTNSANGTEAQAAIVGAASQWSPKATTYVGIAFRSVAAHDLSATGTTATGTSIQRIDDADTNSKADWTTGAGVASTWGALNPGQTAF